MLRRRILASAMASVMALGSVAVVANAEDTQVVSKADLEKLVNETYGDNYRANELSEYGSVSADAMLDALEAAEAILADPDKGEEDWTVAYKMIVAVEKRLVIYTAEELQSLIDECKAIYEGNNILNPELQDLEYDETKYQTFWEAYEYACDYVTSTSSVDITEAYEKLFDAKSKLEKKTTVTKQAFRNIMRQYENIISDEFAYETWRRGSFADAWVNLNSGNYWGIQAQTATYGIVWNAMISLKDDINEAYQSLDAIKTLSKTSDDSIVAGYKMAQDAVAVFGAWAPDSSTRATKAGVNSLLSQYHNCLVYDYNATTTQSDHSAEALYDLIFAANGVDEEGNPKMKESELTPSTGSSDFWFKNGWSDPATKMTDANWNVRSTVTVYVPVDADGYWTGAAIEVGSRPSEDQLPTGAKRWQAISANTNYNILKLIKVDAELVIADLDNTSGNNDIAGKKNNVIDNAQEWDQYADKKVSNKFLIYGEAMSHDEDGDRIQVRNWDDGGNAVDGYYSRIQYALEGKTIDSLDPWNADASDDYSDDIVLSEAYKLAMDYLDGNDSFATMTDEIDTAGVIASKPSGNSKEWALVYRYLKYALEDKYAATVDNTKYTKADVKALIEKCYDLADLTGEAAIFEKSHMAMVEMRQVAREWVTDATADKKYKEYVSQYDGLNSTNMYQKLWGTYETLEKEYNALKYSFGEIYDRIAEVSTMIDDGDLQATADLVAALEDTAYALSVIDDDINNGAYDENPAFDVDRVFQPHNRVITNTGDAQNIATIGLGVTTKDGANPTHAALASAYDALNAAVKAQTEVTALKGDVDGNGTVNVLDASALLINLVNGVAMDAAVADYDANGAINVLDASAILVALVNA